GGNRRYYMFLVLLLCFALARGQRVVVTDAATRMTLPGAAVFDANGQFLCTSNVNGAFSGNRYPLTIRYIGYEEKTVTEPVDTIFLCESNIVLPDVTVEAKKQIVLHMTAYVREYSTLSTYSDTVFLFREKLVDFMLPNPGTKFDGWSLPRVLTSQSYYRFTNSSGLDSVSNRYNNYFSWADWMGIVPEQKLPPRLAVSTTDTLRGKYSPAEIWMKNDNKLTVNVDVLADTTGRKWVPNLSYLMRNHSVDFEQFKLKFDYSVEPTPMGLNGYSFSIESRGRARDMFRFNRSEEPFFVTSYAEIYVLDREFITVKEAKKRGKIDLGELAIIRSPNAPDLTPDVLGLMARVDAIDHDGARMATVTIDTNNFNPQGPPPNMAERAWSMIKGMLGISRYKANRRQNKQWKEFRDAQRERNQENED
ncbi:MAG: carboxypeptidase-like regulatory domain-containing protein, partial [Muribaculaceae bacterium]|nr:carboxypeptidase-like regulatory domain-containing protein [Muribaculaceae bacterium]